MELAKSGIIKGFLLVALSIASAACSPVNFSAATAGGGNPGVVVPDTCNVETIYRKTKILFVVDTSGSNVDSTYNLVGGQNVLTPATDPTKRFRGGAISQFVSDYDHKTNFEWSFVTFSGTSALAHINNGSYQTPAFTPDVTEMSEAINDFYNQRDGGATPYGAALSMAARAISDDPDLNSSEQPHYFVVMLSDGFPSDYLNSNGSFNQAAMNSDVASLVARAPGRVSLSTIFYGQVNIPEAISVLQTMASKGGGQFASVNSSSTSFRIEDVLSSNTCP